MFVKICGITSEEDALLAVAMGADALGFVFAAGSSRLVAQGRVADILRRLPPEIITVGVFRDETPERVVKIVERCRLVGAQLHGHVTPEQLAFISQRISFSLRAYAAGDPAIHESGGLAVTALHVDNHTPGSGQTFDWNLAREIPRGVRFVLAGGLNAANVANAVARVRPWGVDVSTGVEVAPGHKDPRKLRTFISNARRALEAVVGDWDERDPEGEGRRAPGVEAVRSSVYDWENEEG